MFLRRFVMLIFLLSWPFYAAHSTDIGPHVGKRAPVFELATTDNKKVKLTDYAGKAVILNFWASWCGPCRAEMPSLNRLYEDLKDKGLIVLAVSIDRSLEATTSLKSEKGLTFTILMDPEKEVYFDDYAVVALPTTFLIDAEGIIREKFIGEIKWDDPAVRQRIAAYLPSGKKR